MTFFFQKFLIFRNLQGVGLLIYCSDFFLLPSKSSFVFLGFLYLHISYHVILYIFVLDIYYFVDFRHLLIHIHIIVHICGCQHNIYHAKFHELYLHYSILFVIFLIIINFCPNYAVGFFHGVVWVSGSEN